MDPAVAILSILQLYAPIMDQLETRGAHLEYARKQIEFIDSRTKDKDYPLQAKTANEWAECAIFYSLRKENPEKLASELDQEITPKFCPYSPWKDRR